MGQGKSGSNFTFRWQWHGQTALLQLRSFFVGTPIPFIPFPFISSPGRLPVQPEHKMASSKTDLAADISFIDTPPAKPSAFEKQDCGVPTTDVRWPLPT